MHHNLSHAVAQTAPCAKGILITTCRLTRTVGVWGLAQGQELDDGVVHLQCRDRLAVHDGESRSPVGLVVGQPPGKYDEGLAAEVMTEPLPPFILHLIQPFAYLFMQNVAFRLFHVIISALLYGDFKLQNEPKSFSLSVEKAKKS